VPVNAFIHRHVALLKAGVWAACLWPFAALMLGAFQVSGFDLGANPVETLIHELGNWGLRLLLVTLAVTPLREITGWVALTRFRRLLGLFAFFYVVLHFLAYAGVDHRGDLGQIVEDIVERPFITIGIAALLALLPLAITSTRRMRQRLGRRWQVLHRLIYPIAILGVWHFWWQVKKDVREPMVFALVLALLLGWRLFARWRRTVSGSARPAGR